MTDLTDEEQLMYAQFFPPDGSQPAPFTEPAIEPSPIEPETREAKVERAVFRSAAASNGYPASLLDSSSFMVSIEDLDPDDATALSAAITAAVKSNPWLAAPSRLPLPNPAQGSSGSGPSYDGDPEYDRYFPPTRKQAI